MLFTKNIYVNIYQSIPFKSEDEVWAIMAHEFAHLEYNSFIYFKKEEKNMDQILEIRLAEELSEKNHKIFIELVADFRGAKIMRELGKDPCAFVRIFSDDTWDKNNTPKNLRSINTSSYFKGVKRANIMRNFIQTRWGMRCPI